MYRHADCFNFPSGGIHLASGIWTSVSGAAAKSHAVDTIANNLANVDTLGFKKDAPAFKEYLSVAEREASNLEIPRGPIKDKDFYPLDGKDQAFVVVKSSHTNFKPGNYKVTQVPLDLAIDGPGFFEVSTPSGIRYTRQGSFKMATDGQLVTNEGYPVLASQPAGLANAQLTATAVQPGQGGPLTQGGVTAEQGTPPPPDVVARYINLRDLGPNVSVTDTGEIYAGDRLVARIGVAEFANVQKLRKSGAQFFSNPDPANAALPSGKSLVKQGVLETSNVNPVEEMSNLIKANRLFDHDMKVMKTYGELMGREVNDIGKL